MHRVTKRAWAQATVVLWGLGAAACTGQISGTIETDAGANADAGFAPAVDAGFATPDAGVDPVVRVPAELDPLETSEACAPLAAGQSVLGVSPDGHLWLGTSSVATTVTVLDPWSLDTPRTFGLPAADLARVQAVSATVAAFVDAGRLYVVEDGLRTEVWTPGALDPATMTCGDVRREAFVFSAGTLYQRDGDEWLTWTGVEAALDPDARLLARDGACAAGDDAVWFATPGGELWALGADELRRPAAREGGTQAGLLGASPLVLDGGRLFMGPGAWREHDFALGDASALRVAGDAAWLTVGDRLLRFDGEAFRDAGNVDPSATLWPFAAGGVWLVSEDQACHRAPRGTLRTAGVAHGAAAPDAQVVLQAWSGDGSEVSADLDGMALTPRMAGEVSVFEVTLPLGWHALTVRAGDVSRTVQVKRVPTVTRSWAADVQPIVQTHCVACHVPDNAFSAPVLTTFEAWRARANDIRERVIRVGDMPPTASRSPDWGEDEVTVIDEWLSGGLNP